MEPKLTAKQKDILQVQRSLLSRNIVWTPALAHSLKAQSLLTDSMIAQIDNTAGAENKVLTMLDMIPLRTSLVYDKFADALHVSGHTLIADFLREEDLAKQPLDTKDLFKRLPFLAKNMKEAEKKLIEGYMQERIQSAILAHTWQWDTKEKDKALVAKQEQLEESYQHEQEMRRQRDQVLEAQRVAQNAQAETLAARAELRAIAESSSRATQQLKGQVDTQIKFSVANDNISNRLNSRLQTAEATLKAVQEKFLSVVRLTARTDDHALMKLAENPYHFLPEDVDLFVAQFKKLLLTQLKYDDMQEERRYVMTHLGLPSEDNEEEEQASLMKAYKDFESRNDQQIQHLKSAVARYGDLLEEVANEKEEEEKKVARAGTVWQNAIMSVMRKQLGDLKATLRKKDTTIEIKESEISKMKAKIAEVEQSLAERQAALDAAQVRHVNVIDFQELGADTVDGGLGGGGGSSTTPKLRHYNSNNNTTTTAINNTHNNLPPLKSSVSLRTSASPRGAGVPPPGMSRPKVKVAIPRGIVVESATPLTMYPAGLTTMQFKLHQEDPSPGGMGGGARNPASSTSSAKPQMGSGLGDLKAMHAHTKYPPSRGGGTQGGMDPRQKSFHNAAAKQLATDPRGRKFPAKVK